MRCPFCPNVAVHEGLCTEHRRVRGRPWQRLRKQALARAGHRYEMCGRHDVPLEVHHVRPTIGGGGELPPLNEPNGGLPSVPPPALCVESTLTRPIRLPGREWTPE
jgi:hypothetical protein